MSARFAVQCVVLLLALPLAACGGSDQAAVPAAATSVPVVQHGHLRHKEYVRLRALFRAKVKTVPQARAVCARVSHATRLLARVEAECRSEVRLLGRIEAVPAQMRACVARRSPTCMEAVFDSVGARFEATVSAEGTVHAALIARHLGPTCRSVIQGPPGVRSALRRMGASTRELSADVDAGDLQGLLSSASRLKDAARRVIATPHPLKRLKRCAHA